MTIRFGAGRNVFGACLALLVLLAFVGCSSEGDPFGRDVRPVVRVGAVSPPDGATGVSPDVVITITFPLDLDQRTVTKDTVHVLDYSLADTLPSRELDKKPRVLSTKVLFDPATRVVTIIPDQPLNPNGRYQVLVQDVRSTTDVFFNTLVSTFFTGVSNRPVPAVISIVPPTGAVLVEDTSRITLTFDRPMDQVTTLRALSVGPGVAGTAAFSVGVGRTVLVFTPGSRYPAGARIDVTVRPDATDTTGTPLGRAFTSFFTVEPPPRVLEQLIDPPDRATRVPVTTPITVTFSTRMTTGTVADSFSLLTGSTLLTQANGTFSFTENGTPTRTVASFQPANPLPATTSVQIRVNGLARSLRGVPLDPLFFSTFVTAP